MADEVVLSLQDVSIRYGTAVAVDRLCLDVRRGEVLGLLGPNGCGKSSTIAAVAGEVRPCAGVIRLEGVTASERPLDYRRHFGLVPQELAIYEELTAEENLLFVGRLYGLRGRELRERVADALAFVRLTEQARRPARAYSGGMQRRLNVACALLHRPSLLLLDEPTVGVDVSSRDGIFSSLLDLRDRGLAVVIATHHLDEAEQFCDRVAILHRGRLVAQGTLEELSAGLTAAAAVAPQPTLATGQARVRFDAGSVRRPRPRASGHPGHRHPPALILESLLSGLNGRGGDEPC